MDLLGLKNEANEEVPQSCILSIGQPNQLLSLDLLPQGTVAQQVYGLSHFFKSFFSI